MLKLIEKVVGYIINEYNPESTTPIELDIVSRLKSVVEEVSFKRDMHQNPESLIRARNYILDKFKSNCDFCNIQGDYGNVIGSWEITDEKEVTLIGGHFDGPPGSPGADDNGSAIACLVVLAEQLKLIKPKNVILAAFNGEEYGFLGSKDFVKNHKVKQAIIFEMVGYYSKDSGSQTMPVGFPPIDVGDFLAIIGNRHSERVGNNLVKQANLSGLNLPIKEIKIPFGLEEKIDSLSHVRRSDHSPFWDEKIPAVMLTDTAEFRNKNYHTSKDLPNTLDYDSMSEVVRLVRDFVLNKK